MTWTTTQIKDGIAAWTAILNNVSALESAFAQGNYINCNYPFYQLTSGTIHAYPALQNNLLYFVLIPSIYDNATSDIGANSFVAHIEGTLGGTNRITSKEALSRIDRWKKNYKTWIPQQVNSTYGMFQAFDIERQDFECADTKLFLGLINTPAASVSQTVDLIVANQETTVLYDDFSKPVPPFGTGPAAAQSSFYLIDTNFN